MRKSEPDSKYFVKIRGNLRLPCQNLQKLQKMCKLFTVWLPKELTNVQVFSEFARISPNFRILFENREFVNLF